jgi:hypothetical protein
MKLANATNLDRKSGGAEGRDLQCALVVKQNPEMIAQSTVSMHPKVKLQVPRLGMTKFRAAFTSASVDMDGQSPGSSLPFAQPG